MHSFSSLSSAPTAFYTLSLHDALPILFRSFRTAVPAGLGLGVIASVTSTPISYLVFGCTTTGGDGRRGHRRDHRSEEHTSELQSHHDLVCRLLLEKKKTNVDHNLGGEE